jgi:hypothetical protein
VIGHYLQIEHQIEQFYIAGMRVTRSASALDVIDNVDWLRGYGAGSVTTKAWAAIAKSSDALPERPQYSGVWGVKPTHRDELQRYVSEFERFYSSWSPVALGTSSAVMSHYLAPIIAATAARPLTRALHVQPSNPGTIAIFEDPYKGDKEHDQRVVSITLPTYHSIAAAKSAPRTKVRQLRRLFAGCQVVWIEPVQLWGTDGPRFHSVANLKLIRHLCTETNTLLIFDETLGGLRYTGPCWSYQLLDNTIEPDQIVFGKGHGLSGIAARRRSRTVEQLREKVFSLTTVVLQPMVLRDAAKLLEYLRCQKLPDTTIPQYIIGTTSRTKHLGHYIWLDKNDGSFPQCFIGLRRRIILPLDATKDWVDAALAIDQKDVPLLICTACGTKDRASLRQCPTCPRARCIECQDEMCTDCGTGKATPTVRLSTQVYSGPVSRLFYDFPFPIALRTISGRYSPGELGTKDGTFFARYSPTEIIHSFCVRPFARGCQSFCYPVREFVQKRKKRTAVEFYRNFALAAYRGNENTLLLYYEWLSHERSTYFLLVCNIRLFGYYVRVFGKQIDLWHIPHSQDVIVCFSLRSARASVYAALNR